MQSPLMHSHLNGATSQVTLHFLAMYCTSYCEIPSVQPYVTEQQDAFVLRLYSVALLLVPYPAK